MINPIKQSWKAAPIATLVFAVALAAGVFFSVRTAAHWVYWNDARHQDQAIAGWMTPRYIAHSWRVPPEVVIEALRISRPNNGPRNLDQFAAEQDRPVADLIAELETAIAVFRASQSTGSGQEP